MTGAEPRDVPFAYLATTGRVTGTQHTIEIWFARSGSTLYMLAGGGRRADWVKNLLRDPAVIVRVGELETEATARIVTDPEEEAVARRLVFEKYQPSYSGDLSRWREDALPVAVDLPSRPG